MSKLISCDVISQSIWKFKNLIPKTLCGHSTHVQKKTRFFTLTNICNLDTKTLGHVYFTDESRFVTQNDSRQAFV